MMDDTLFWDVEVFSPGPAPVPCLHCFDNKNYGGGPGENVIIKDIS